jgi:hypothetical protein
LRENSQQVIELPAGYQHELSAGGEQPLEGSQCAFSYDAFMGQRFVKVASKSEIVHSTSMMVANRFYKGRCEKTALNSAGSSDEAVGQELETPFSGWDFIASVPSP